MINEIGKYRKRKSSNKSKSKLKSKHKHIYKEVLYLTEKYNRVYKGSYCTICGKINNIEVIGLRKKDGCIRFLTREEVIELYKDLEKIEIKDITQRFI